MTELGQHADNLWTIFLTLPFITQSAIIILVVFGVVAHVAYNERVVHDGPSVLTTGGIFLPSLELLKVCTVLIPHKSMQVFQSCWPV